MTAAGIPVMAHIGFTPQSVNSLGGFRVQGRGDAAEQTIHDAIAVAEAGAFAVVMEMVPAELATQITGKLTIPTVGIGAGPQLRRPGAGLAGHGRTDQRQDRQVRQAVRRRRRRITPRGNAVRRRGGVRHVPRRGAQLLNDPSRYLEIERKFDVDASTQPPSFDGLSGISRTEHAQTQALDAVYFDTVDA